MTDCIFCKIASGEIGTAFVYEDDSCVAFRDLHPKAPVHILVIPRSHIAGVHNISDNDVMSAGRLLRAARIVAEKEGIAQQGYRLIINSGADGGQEVPHLHVHVIGGKKLGAMA